ncbi:MAG: VWA domain-containing protein, partial [Hyphomicrobiales bacterium]|nr:VWA domain-containing protein [Hyphomicrobiales bacterium]
QRSAIAQFVEEGPCRREAGGARLEAWVGGERGQPDGAPSDAGQMRQRNRQRALAGAANLVADWDGGTRIGEALGAFLGIPRFAALARGAALVVLSDGLERGDPSAMREAVAHLSRIAWRTVWLTPLAGDKNFEPRTAGLAAVWPFLDELGDGGSLDSICAHVLELARKNPA